MPSELEEDFHQIDTHDVPLLKKYLSLSKYEEGNHNLVGFMIWLDYYPLWKYEGEHWLILLGVHEGELFIYMPLCEETYFDQAIIAAKRIFDRYGLPFILSCYTKEAMDKVLALFPNYHAQAYRDAADYVYLTEKLRSFSGKKLQKKRNHLNSFYKQYEQRWTYEKLTSQHTDEIIAFLSNWHREDDDVFLAYEKCGILRVLELWDELDARGGIIRIDGKIEAFCIGTQVNEQMCQMNVEKANEAIRGLYQAICQTFLQHEFLDTLYVNREDDMGLENIRHAKEAYYPDHLIMKYRLAQKETM